MIYDDGIKVKNAKQVEYEINSGGCWIVTSHAKDKDGYIRFKRNGKNLRLHRWVYEIHNNKKIDEGNIILHSCDNPSCINPEHLSEGTISDNTLDMYSKNRSPLQKLTFELAEEIRYRYKNEDITQKQLAKEYGVGKTAIYNIVNNKKWTRRDVYDV